MLYVLVILRVVFIFLVLACNHPAGSMIPPLITSDWGYGLIIIMFGLSTGYLGTLCMVYGATYVKTIQSIGQALDKTTLQNTNNSRTQKGSIQNVNRF